MSAHEKSGSGRGLTRRAALVGVAGVTAAAACATRPTPPPAPTGVFRHGVASGDPLSDRVIIWTRVSAPADYSAPVEWTVARDRGLTDIVRSGTAAATLDTDFTVKIDVDGLEPGRDYFYGFAAAGERSGIGRARTLPEGALEAMTLAVCSCSNYPAGYFTAYRSMSRRADVDLVLHLGDYIYEYGAGGYATGQAERLGRVPDPVHEIVSLADYRRRYAQYRSDPDLQAAHAAAPWVCVWDDHEVANDSSRDGADNHQPETEGAWSARRAAALQAYYEWMPVREPANGRARREAWRTLELGDLATLVMLETRLAERSRSIPFSEFPVDPGADPDDPAVREAVRRFITETLGDPDRVMLGAAQLADVSASLSASTAAGKPWQLLGNQTQMGAAIAPNYMETLPFYVRWYARMRGGEVWDYVRRSRLHVPMSFDCWDGYTAERERLFTAARAARANMVTLTGDSHTFFAATLLDAGGARAGVELGATSISSPSEFDNAPPGVDFGRLTVEANPETTLYHNPTVRGYLVVELTRQSALASMVGVTTVHRPTASDMVVAQFRTAPSAEGGTTGLERVDI